MAVTRVNQGEIVEVPFELPDGSILPHPALVLSNQYLQDYEDGLFCRIVRLDKVSYLCTIILNYSNYGTRQETIKQQTKVCRGCNR